MDNRKSLPEIIQENIRNGELPESFSLPKEPADSGRITWADGAYDGAGIFHLIRPVRL